MFIPKILTNEEMFGETSSIPKVLTNEEMLIEEDIPKVLTDEEMFRDEADELEETKRKLEQAQAEKIKQMELQKQAEEARKNDPRNWSAEQTKEVFKETPATTPDEAIQQKTMIKMKEEEEKQAVEQNVNIMKMLADPRTMLDVATGGMTAPITRPKETAKGLETGKKTLSMLPLVERGLIEGKTLPDIAKEGVEIFKGNAPEVSGEDVTKAILQRIDENHPWLEWEKKAEGEPLFEKIEYSPGLKAIFGNTLPPMVKPTEAFVRVAPRKVWSEAVNILNADLLMGAPATQHLIKARWGEYLAGKIPLKPGLIKPEDLERIEGALREAGKQIAPTMSYKQLLKAQQKVGALGKAGQALIPGKQELINAIKELKPEVNISELQSLSVAGLQETLSKLGGKLPEQPLIEEAKKYKSAEEFVTSQDIYNKSMIAVGEKRGMLSIYPKDKRMIIQSIESAIKGKDMKILEELKVEFDKRESQLTDIWNKAQQQPAETPPTVKEEMPKAGGMPQKPQQPTQENLATKSQKITLAKAIKEKALTPNQTKRLLTSMTGKNTISGKVENPMTQEEAKKAIEAVKGVVPKKPEITGQPPVIPTSKHLVPSEWSGPFNDLLSMESVPASGLDPIRAAEKVDDKPYGPVRKFIVDPIRQAGITARKKTIDDFAKVDNMVGNLSKNKKITEALFDYIEKKETALKLPESIKEKFGLVDKEFRATFDNLFEEINKVRKIAGKIAIPYRKDYITHLSAYNMLAEMFGGLHNVPDKVIADMPEFVKPNSPFFRFSLQRKGGVYEKDPVKAIKTYIRLANNVIAKTPYIKQARELAKRLPPNAQKYFQQYINETGAGSKPTADKMLPSEIIKGLKWTTAKTSKGAILGNVASMLNQVWTLPNVTSATDAIATSKATLKLFDPYYRAFAEKYSKTLQGRIFEIDFDPTFLSKADNILGFMLQFLDREMTRLAFLSGFEKVKGDLPFEEAVRYADDIAFKTQSDFNLETLPPVLRSQIGRTLFQFQNTVNNGFNYLTYDIGKDYTGDRKKWGIFKASLMFLGTFLVMRRAAEELGVKGPIEHWWDLIPLISMAKFGAPAAIQLPTSLIQLGVADSKWERTQALNSLRRSIYLYFPAGNQIRKTLEGIYWTLKGGKVNKKGKVQFPIEGKGEVARAVIFGPYGTREGQEYIKRGFKAEKSESSGRRGRHTGHSRRRRRH